MTSTAQKLEAKRERLSAEVSNLLSHLQKLVNERDRSAKVEAVIASVNKKMNQLTDVVEKLTDTGDETAKHADAWLEEFRDNVASVLTSASMELEKRENSEIHELSGDTVKLNQSEPFPEKISYRPENTDSRSIVNPPLSIRSGARSKASSKSSARRQELAEQEKQLRLQQLAEEAEAEELIQQMEEQKRQTAAKIAAEAARAEEEAVREAARVAAENARLIEEENARAEAEINRLKREQALKKKKLQVHIDSTRQMIEEQSQSGSGMSSKISSIQKTEDWLDSIAKANTPRSNVIGESSSAPQRKAELSPSAPIYEPIASALGSIPDPPVPKEESVPVARRTERNFQPIRNPTNSTFIRDVPNIGPSSSIHGPSSQLVRSLEKYLPKWTLQTFSGNPLDFPEWSGMFESTVMRAHISDSEKMTHLKTLLTGKAKAAIAGFAYNGTMFTQAWEVLQRKFGQPSVIVSAQLDTLFRHPQVKMHSSEQLIEYSIVITSLVSVLQNMGYVYDLKSAANLDSAVKKLPPNLKEKWFDYLTMTAEPTPDLVVFDEWLQYQSETHEKLLRTVSNFNRSTEVNQQKGFKSKPSTTVAAVTSNGKEGPRSPATGPQDCFVCDSKHRIWYCEEFKKKNPTERAQVAKKHNLCFACLEKNHTARQCEKKRKCTVPNCNSFHNSLLHGAERVNSQKSPSGDDPTVQLCARSVKGLLQTVMVNVGTETKSARVLAFCDTGASESWISSGLKEELGLKGEPKTVSVHNFDGVTNLETETCEVKIDSTCMKEEEKLKVLVKPDLYLSNSVIDLPALKRAYPHLSPVPSVKHCLRDVKLILGQNAFHLIRPLEYRCKDNNGPWAVRLRLGWTVSGPLPQMLREQSVKTEVHAGISAEKDAELTDQVRKWWDIESYASRCETAAQSKEEEQAMKMLEENTVKEDSRYVVPMLWKKGTPDMPNNYIVARSNFASLEKRLNKDLALKKRYADTIAVDLEKGYVRKVTHEELTQTKDEVVWYVPHHPVINPNKPEKVRRVCNAASKFQGKSLNDYLMTGPDLLNNLFGLLMRFRTDPIAVVADIEAMFLQVKVPQKDARTLRFLWREDPSQEIAVYEYTVHIFGATDSPNCANYALKRTGRDNHEVHPEAATTVQRDFYMDDFVKSLGTIIKAFDTCLEVYQIVKSGGFNLTKWQSNDEQLLEKLKNAGLTIAETCEEMHVLGLKWVLNPDYLVVSRGTKHEVPNDVTQRTILSIVSSIYDPLGMIAPYTITARLVLKSVWQQHGQQWDEPINEEDKKDFLKWIEQLRKIPELRLRRQYFLSMPEKLQLHVFADASSVAMCAAIYIRAEFASGQPELAFVIGKCRVAPMKQLTVPKLELQAALIASRLAEMVKSELDYDFEKIIYWSDSSTVLQWLRSLHKKLPIFVSNRATEILKLTTVDQWRYVPSEDNPADCGTRGLSLSVLAESPWLTGPAFLLEHEDAWPIGNFVTAKQSEEIVCEAAASSTDCNPPIDWTRFRTYDKLTRSIAYCLRLLPRLRKSSFKKEIITAEELYRAREKIWYLCQRESFGEELDALEKNERLPKKTSLGPLSPFIGLDGIMRSAGRLRKAEQLSFATKYPLILTASHPAVKLFLRYMHLLHNHQGVEYLKSLIQQEFWIIRMRSALRTIKFTCVPCQKRDGTALQPQMADLPMERVTSRQFPFTDLGVDYFGPFEVKFLRKTLKRWCFLFCCLATRAVHIEVVHSLDTDSCLMAIKRFCARRGVPRTVKSDNGTNFVGAVKEMKLCLDSWNQEVIETSLAQMGIKWSFTPPASPHFGGIWERLVRSCKRAMYDILGSRRLTDETLITTMCLVEQTLNARPLTAVSSDIEDMEALSPNHFLLGRPSLCLPSFVTKTADLHLRKQYRQAEAYADQVWQRWLREYVPTLNKRPKWYSPDKRQLSTGDLVWLAEHTQPRSVYIMGRIIDTYPGDDGIVRTAKVRTKLGEYIRPAVKMVPLDLPTDEDVSPGEETGPAMLPRVKSLGP